MPGCVTVTLLPPAVIVALRALVVPLVTAVYATVPLPLPEPLTVSQDVALLADQEQADGAVMLNDPLPPPVATAVDDGDRA
jgi:hypothetical protein